MYISQTFTNLMLTSSIGRGWVHEHRGSRLSKVGCPACAELDRLPLATHSRSAFFFSHNRRAALHFERRPISELTKDGIAAARANGKLPGRQPIDMAKVDAAIKLIEARVLPAEAVR